MFHHVKVLLKDADLLCFLRWPEGEAVVLPQPVTNLLKGRFQLTKKWISNRRVVLATIPQEEKKQLRDLDLE